MPTHAVDLKISHAIAIGGVDITLPVRRGRTLLGTLTISRGGVDWRKAHARSSVSLNWAKFAEMMAEVE
jgi:hypothetical protein